MQTLQKILLSRNLGRRESAIAHTWAYQEYRYQLRRKYSYLFEPQGHVPSGHYKAREKISKGLNISTSPLQ